MRCHYFQILQIHLLFQITEQKLNVFTIHQQLLEMLSVMPQQSASFQEDSIEVEQPSEVQEMPINKQQLKTSVFTPLNILLIISVITIMGLGTYYLLDITPQADLKSSITQSHDKIISNTDSSKKEGSSSGSSSSKSSSGNSKPNPKSLPASKGTISSNPSLIGGGQMGSGDGEPPNDDDDNGEKRDKKLKKGSSTVGGSTQDQQSEEQEDDEQNADDGVYWVDTKLQGNSASPLVGKARP